MVPWTRTCMAFQYGSKVDHNNKSSSSFQLHFHLNSCLDFLLLSNFTAFEIIIAWKAGKRWRKEIFYEKTWKLSKIARRKHEVKSILMESIFENLCSIPKLTITIVDAPHFLDVFRYLTFSRTVFSTVRVSTTFTEPTLFVPLNPKVRFYSVSMSEIFSIFSSFSIFPLLAMNLTNTK